MTSRKFSLIIVTFLVTILCSTFVFAKDDNAIRDAGSSIANVTKDAGTSMMNDVKNAGAGIRGGVENVGNAIGDGVSSMTGAVTNNDNNDNNNDYTATRTNAETAEFMGMNPITWIWFSLAIAGAIIIALVWTYGKQHASYNNND